MVAAAVATAVLWDHVGRLAGWFFWTLPARVSPTVAWVGVGVGIFLALPLVIVAVSATARAWRPTVAMVLAGVDHGHRRGLPAHRAQHPHQPRALLPHHVVPQLDLTRRAAGPRRRRFDTATPRRAGCAPPLCAVYPRARALTIALSALVPLRRPGHLPQHVFDEYYYAHDAAALLHGDLGPRAPSPGDRARRARSRTPSSSPCSRPAASPLFGDGPWGWRLPAALAGTLLIALVYPLARRLRLPPVWALAATVLAAADTMLVVESRLAVLDISWPGTAACVYCALRARRRRALLAVDGALRPGAAAPPSAASGPGPRRGRRPACSSPWLRAGSAAVAWPPPPAPGRLAAAVYVASYAGYFASGHSSPTSSTCSATCSASTGACGYREFASRRPWPLDVHPIWFVPADEPAPRAHTRQPAAWWSALAGFVVLGSGAGAARPAARAGAAAGRRPVPAVAATTRQAYIYYMTPVVPFLAVLVARRSGGSAATGAVPAAGAGLRRRRSADASRWASPASATASLAISAALWWRSRRSSPAPSCGRRCAWCRAPRGAEPRGALARRPAPPAPGPTSAP